MNNVKYKKLKMKKNNCNILLLFIILAGMILPSGILTASGSVSPSDNFQVSYGTTQTFSWSYPYSGSNWRANYGIYKSDGTQMDYKIGKPTSGSVPYTLTYDGYFTVWYQNYQKRCVYEMRQCVYTYYVWSNVGSETTHWTVYYTANIHVYDGAYYASGTQAIKVPVPPTRLVIYGPDGQTILKDLTNLPSNSYTYEYHPQSSTSTIYVQAFYKSPYNQVTESDTQAITFTPSDHIKDVDLNVQNNHIIYVVKDANNPSGYSFDATNIPEQNYYMYPQFVQFFAIGNEDFPNPAYNNPALYKDVDLLGECVHSIFIGIATRIVSVTINDYGSEKLYEAKLQINTLYYEELDPSCPINSNKQMQFTYMPSLLQVSVADSFLETGNHLSNSGLSWPDAPTDVPLFTSTIENFGLTPNHTEHKELSSDLGIASKIFTILAYTTANPILSPLLKGAGFISSFLAATVFKPTEVVNIKNEDHDGLAWIKFKEQGYTKTIFNPSDPDGYGYTTNYLDESGNLVYGGTANLGLQTMVLNFGGDFNAPSTTLHFSLDYIFKSAACEIPFSASGPYINFITD